MVVSLSIRDNIAQVQKRLTAIERRQIPFAASQAINDTVKDIRKRIVEVTAPRAFTLRNRRFISSQLRMEFATKRRLVGAVFDAKGRGQLELHARGGIKRPRGRHLAIPTEDVKAKRTGSGRIPKRLTPRTVLNKAGRRRAFVVTFRSGQEAIVRRIGKGRQPLEVLHLLERRARIPRSFRFFEDAKKVTKARFKRHFERRLRQALRTAR